ncbi:MAG: glycine/sarcosine/betaine reductase selenoprotein B family protein [Desulfosalsimonas sp.]
MSIEYMKLMNQLYTTKGYSAYRWVKNDDPPPWQSPGKPLSQCRLALLASGGIYATGQTAFHFKDDTSYRAIPKNIRTEDLRATHFAYDLTAARNDPNSVFPLDTLHQMVSEGVIGELCEHAYTFMGGIYSSRRVKEELAPSLTERLLEDRADLALLVPC